MKTTLAIILAVNVVIFAVVAHLHLCN